MSLIDGTIAVSGADGHPGGTGTVALIGAGGEGGPGGFAGGNGGRGVEFGGAAFTDGGRGLGPGGGAQDTRSCCTENGAGAGFGVPGFPVGLGGGPAYGTASLLPLIGGSGGGGGDGANSNGGGGGGAILIASSGTITVNGSITSKGGVGAPFTGNNPGGGGSGGGIRLVANTIAGNGSILAIGGGGGTSPGGRGRIRLEANTLSHVGNRDPVASIATPGPAFVTPNPTLAITAVAGLAAPASPTGSFTNPDIVLSSSTSNPVTVDLAATNVPLGTTIQVSVIRFNGLTVNTASAVLAGTLESSTATASVNIPLNQSSVLVAEVTFQLSASAGHSPVMVAGEVVKAIKVAATYGGGSTVTYITASGKEVGIR